MTLRSAARAELARRELARRHYLDFLRLSAHGWRDTRFASYLAERIQRFLLEPVSGAYGLLILETPPQHGKSMTVTEGLAAWYMGRQPEKRVILASYNDETAGRFLRRNREKLLRWGPDLFGVSPGGRNTEREIELSGHAGRLLSRGIMSGITGNPADLLIIDDPIKNREEADSETYREKLWQEWQNSLKSRLQAGAHVVVILTPWHEDDLAGRLLRTDSAAELVRLPVEAEEGDLLGRAVGEALCPELGKDDAWLAQFKAGYISDEKGGRRAWQALYQCSPRVEEGNLIRRSWWRWYDAAPPMGTDVLSVDAAFKGEDNNDFVALTVWRKSGGDYYLLDAQNKHLTFTETLQAIRDTAAAFGVRTVLIEDKANGPAILDVLREDPDLWLLPVDPRGGKFARASAVSPAIESGHVFLPRSAPWVEEYVNQWSQFPNAAHDDLVDSSSQALTYLFGVPQTREPTEAERRLEEEEAASIEALTGDGLFDVYGNRSD